MTTAPREFIGRDLVEALQQAAKAFGVRRNQIGHELIDEGRKGLFGLGSKACVIRAWPRVQQDPEDAMPDTSGRTASGGGGGGGRGRGGEHRRSEEGGGRGGRGRGGRGRGRDGEGRGGESRGGGRGEGRGESRGGRGEGRGGRGEGRGEGRDGRRRGRGGGGGDQARARQQDRPRREPMMDEDDLPARLSDRPPGQRDDGRRGGRGGRRRDGGGGPGGGRGGRGRGGGERQRGGGERQRGGGEGGGGRGRGGRGGGRRQDEDRRREGVEAAQGEQRGGGRRRRRRSRAGGRGTDAPAAAAEAGREKTETVPANEDHAQEMLHLLEEIVAHWGLDLDPSVRVENDTVRLELAGDDAARLAEDDGRVLQALQYLVSKVASRVLDDNVRVLLEAAGWREGRDEALHQRALDIAKEVAESGRKVRLEPLNAYERRIVHLALKDDEAIRTYSIGRGYLKRVTIEPVTEEDLAEDLPSDPDEARDQAVDLVDEVIDDLDDDSLEESEQLDDDESEEDFDDEDDDDFDDEDDDDLDDEDDEDDEDDDEDERN